MRRGWRTERTRRRATSVRAPIPTLQVHAQLNTITELVNQREQARLLKRHHIPAAAALHSNFHGGPLLTTALDDIPPWSYTSITTNKTTKLRRRDQPTSTPETTVPDGHCVVYTDAAVLPQGGRIAFVSPTHPVIEATHRYETQAPDSLLLELQAIYDAIQTISTLPNITETHIYTDSLSAVKHLKQVTRTLQVCQEIHNIHKSSNINIKVHWVQGHGQDHFNHMADQNAHTPTSQEHLPTPLPPDPRSLLLARKSLLRRDTRGD